MRESAREREGKLKVMRDNVSINLLHKSLLLFSPVTNDRFLGRAYFGDQTCKMDQGRRRRTLLSYARLTRCQVSIVNAMTLEFFQACRETEKTNAF